MQVTHVGDCVAVGDSPGSVVTRFRWADLGAEAGWESCCDSVGGVDLAAAAGVFAVVCRGGVGFLTPGAAPRVRPSGACDGHTRASACVGWVW